MSLCIDPAERARRLGDVAAILIDLGRKARLARAAESTKSGQPSADDAPPGDEAKSRDHAD
jgi:hypothetical protein